MDGQHSKWTLYLVVSAILVLVSVSEPAHSGEHGQHHRYVIVFDGGSTGTRIHVFTFINNNSNVSLVLQNEYFEEVKPGLSHYAAEPSNATGSVIPLLDGAKEIVPMEQWEDTPVTLLATAGLRLLPNTESDSLLDAVRVAFKDSPFVFNDGLVQVLDGQHEGLYGWFTLNFLLGRTTSAEHSVVSLDLGGGSTQVTFTPVELDTFINSPKGYITKNKFQNRTRPIYSHSYLGLGLMSARKAILRLSSDNYGASRTKEIKFKSVCIPPHLKTIWDIDRHEYIVKGRKDEKYGFKECYQKSVEFLHNSVDKPEELKKREIYAISYYFDRAKDLGLVGDMGGLITVGDFMGACKKHCSAKKSKAIFLCLDCSYISALLHHSLGLDETKEIHLEKQIDGMETSWALGAALNLLT